jgi:micrococcal nuclease
MTVSRTARILLAVLLIAAGITSQRLLGRVMPTSAPLPPDVYVPDGFVLVTVAVDGDTIELADGSRIRYIGVDTPETVHPSKPVQCFGHEASAFNRMLVEGRPVRLERDMTDTDQYGRLLRYVYLENGTFVNLELVRQGYASVVTYPPDVAHAATLTDAQREARAAGRGLWSACQ